MSTRKLELLAPAKNLECGIAAIDHGADAVYIGAKRFGARVAAGNSTEDIAALCQYAHQFGAKVFVTINTVIHDEEIDDTIELVEQLDAIGVDALLIQDMGLFSILRKMPLKCALHASTQTDNRSAEKVKWLSEIGFRRVVLARELSVEEISSIHDATPDTELEVFVHGALCVSYSGQCYASEYCFNRSANRGECAQFCRLAFTLKDADGRVLENGRHLLSLKDMSQLENLEELAEAGAVSFKIEGRLKDVDYVKNVTAAYSQRLDEIVARHPDKYSRASFGRVSYTFQPDITKSFNRGFTEYFAHGRPASLVSFNTPKAMGQYVGKVKELRGKSFNVAGTANFTNGDGLCFLNASRQLVGFRVNKVEGNRIFPLTMPEDLRPGTALYRNHDKAFNDILQRPSAQRTMFITFSLSAGNGKVQLKGTDEMGRTATSEVECELQKAEKPQEENIRRQLSKLGGTIYQCKDIAISTDAFIPSSVLATLRRNVVELCLAEKQSASTADAIPTGTNDTQISAPQNCGNKYSTPYLYNVRNANAQEFYAEQGVEIPDSVVNAPQLPMLMQCRYCLRNEMGYCTKSGKRAPWREPLTISMSDGREFTLQFDCKNCQMNVIVRS